MNALNKFMVSVIVLTRQQKIKPFPISFEMIDETDLNFKFTTRSCQLTLLLIYETEQFHLEVHEFYFVAYNCIAYFGRHTFESQY